MFEKPKGGGLKKPRALKEASITSVRMHIDMVSTDKSIFTARRKHEDDCSAFPSLESQKTCKSPSF